MQAIDELNALLGIGPPKPKLPITLQRSGYEPIRELGKGGFGAALLIFHRKQNKYYVAKHVNLAPLTAKQRKEAHNEITMLQRANHPNIVRYVEFCEEFPHLYIIMEYADGGDVYTHLKKLRQEGRMLSEQQAVNLFAQTALAVKYMHDQLMLHRDIKAQNVFLTKAHVVKLGDFGISTVLQSTMAMAQTMCGTPCYFSPELCQGKPYNNKSDVWALGVLMYELCTTKLPFEALNVKRLMDDITRTTPPRIPKRYSDELASLTRLLLTKDPAQRPDIDAVLRHPAIRRCTPAILEQLEPLIRAAPAPAAGPALYTRDLPPARRGVPGGGSPVHAAAPAPPAPPPRRAEAVVSAAPRAPEPRQEGRPEQQRPQVIPSASAAAAGIVRDGRAGVPAPPKAPSPPPAPAVAVPASANGGVPVVGPVGEARPAAAAGSRRMSGGPPPMARDELVRDVLMAEPPLPQARREQVGEQQALEGTDALGRIVPHNHYADTAQDGRYVPALLAAARLASDSDAGPALSAVRQPSPPSAAPSMPPAPRPATPTEVSEERAASEASDDGLSEGQRQLAHVVRDLATLTLHGARQLDSVRDIPAGAGAVAARAASASRDDPPPEESKYFVDAAGTVLDVELGGDDVERVSVTDIVVQIKTATKERSAVDVKAAARAAAAEVVDDDAKAGDKAGDKSLGVRPCPEPAHIVDRVLSPRGGAAKLSAIGRRSSEHHSDPSPSKAPRPSQSTGPASSDAPDAQEEQEEEDVPLEGHCLCGETGFAAWLSTVFGTFTCGCPVCQRLAGNPAGVEWMHVPEYAVADVLQPGSNVRSYAVAGTRVFFCGGCGATTAAEHSGTEGCLLARTGLSDESSASFGSAKAGSAPSTAEAAAVLDPSPVVARTVEQRAAPGSEHGVWPSLS